jgi:hypothetical protein
VSYQYRRIFKNQFTGAATLKELVQTMFVGELLGAGEAIWIVSPWVSNIILIDNRSGNFDSINPEWGRREIRLVEVLATIMGKGTKVVLVTRNLDTNQAFIAALREQVTTLAIKEMLDIVIRDGLHTKGILLTRSMLLGSMNLTYSGLEMHDEYIEFCINPEDLARTRLEFGPYLGSQS